MIVCYDSEILHNGCRYIAENRVIADSKGRKVAHCMNNTRYVGVVRRAGKALRGRKNADLVQTILRKAAEGLKVC